MSRNFGPADQNSWKIGCAEKWSVLRKNGPGQNNGPGKETFVVCVMDLLCCAGVLAVRKSYL